MPDAVDRSTDRKGIEAGWVDAALGGRHASRQPPSVHRARSLLLIGLVGALLIVLWLRLLAAEPHWPLVWQLADDGSLEVDADSDATLRPMIGERLSALLPFDGQPIEAGAALLHRSPRWIVDDAQRQRWDEVQQRVSAAVRQPSVTLRFLHSADLTLAPRPRGFDGLGATCWLMAALALALYLSSAVVVLTTPGLPALLYVLLAASQSVNLLLIGAESLPGMGLPSALLRWDLPVRLLADATAAAALVHLCLLYPRRRPASSALAVPVWAIALGGTALLLWRSPPGLWWGAQGLSIAGAVVAAGLLRGPRQRPAQALGHQLQRMVMAGAGTLLLLSLAVATTDQDGLAQYLLATTGTVAWAVFFSALLMLAPFLSSSRQVLREFTVLAGVSSVTISLWLLSINLLALGEALSMLLAAAASVALYLLARPWILGHLARSGMLGGERLFDSLYRAARALEQAPERADELLAGLLQEVFDPRDVARTQRKVSRVRVAADGTTLVVPIAPLRNRDAGATPDDDAVGAIVLRHAGHGRRLFTQEDCQLCERLLEQLRRAVAYDHAVEHGRAEERARIAQDLHDDIGARLLTLMYKAQDPEIEEYLRHTLQDLKTLTRGLAASNHRLSHAVAEWKADITQRLNAAGCQLEWQFTADRDRLLSVVEWSALTRVLRELVNNIISHAQANQVEITVGLERGQLQLLVSDDGQGRSPEHWSHGLGLGGVRKRVKLLGGQVQWTEREALGIRCEVKIPLTAAKS